MLAIAYITIHAQILESIATIICLRKETDRLLDVGSLGLWRTQEAVFADSVPFSAIT